jgi:hypothetical protein
MSDGIANQFKYWDEGEENGWARFKEAFLLKPQASRIQDLVAADSFLDQQTALTREHADLVVKRRELFDLHTRLRNAGR